MVDGAPLFFIILAGIFMQKQIQFLLLNVAHFLDHLFMLVFATLAALMLSREWGLDYSVLIAYATPGFIAFGAFALPAGWLADRWNRHAMMVIFFIGIGASAIVASLADSPLQISLGLFLIGAFAAIYHPVGIALVLEGHERSGVRIAVNGVWGNMGVACAALLTAWFIDSGGWRAAFVWPGVLSILLGVVYYVSAVKTEDIGSNFFSSAVTRAGRVATASESQPNHKNFSRILVVVFLSTALGGLLFQSTTFALPKVLSERMSEVTVSATVVGQLAFIAFFAGSMGQLVVGYLIDRISPRKIFMWVAALQVVFFTIAVSAHGKFAMVAAVGYMLVVFGQIPINDVLVGRITHPGIRSRILGIRYTITILVMASAIPLIAAIHLNYGFGALFKLLAGAAAVIFLVVCMLPLNLAAQPKLPSAS